MGKKPDSELVLEEQKSTLNGVKEERPMQK